VNEIVLVDIVAVATATVVFGAVTIAAVAKSAVGILVFLIFMW